HRERRDAARSGGPPGRGPASPAGRGRVLAPRSPRPAGRPPGRYPARPSEGDRGYRRRARARGGPRQEGAVRPLHAALRPRGLDRRGEGGRGSPGGDGVIFEIVTLFPRLVQGPLQESILGKAIDRGLIEVRVRDLREHAHDKHRVTDDTPYGGGAGMVMKVEPLVEAIEHARASLPGARVVLLDPAGRRFDQTVAREYAAAGRLVLVCGRYEGVDERVRHFVDEELPLG